MKIKNTDHSYCKIKDVKISGLKAYITLIVYSSAPQTSQDNLGNIDRVFSFYLRDLNSDELHKLSHNNYWIDRTHNYNNEGINIDINMYKEIILEVDITNNNKSTMLNDRWIRQCNIIMVDITTDFEEVWHSETLELMSKEIQLPELYNIKINSTKENIELSFNYKYESQEDFNYTNDNLITAIEIKSVYTHHIIHTEEELNSSIQKLSNDKIIFTLDKYTEPININIILKTLKGDILKKYSKLYNPAINNLNITIKEKYPKDIINASIKYNKIIKEIASINRK